MALFHSGSKSTPAIPFVVLVITILLFICGLVLFLVKLLKKQRLSSIFQSNRPLDFSSSSAFQRQLQHLFHSHDSGLDQSLIDALPMFIYKDIMGVSGPFDCPVCLCEFSEEEKLRLLPLCKHAFHLKCIDTWLQSNSTCPLCRSTLFNPGSLHQSPEVELDDSRNAEGFSVNVGDVIPSVTKPAEPENNMTEKKVFSVRLGKFRHTNESERHEDIELGEASNINLDSRRCFSMGSVQYVVADTEFQVALCANRAKANSQGLKVLKGKGECNQNTLNDEKKITKKRESFSISKTWLWPKKSKIPNNRENHFSKSIRISPPNKLGSSMKEVSTANSVALADQVCSRDEYVCDSSRQLNSDPEEKSDAASRR